MLKLLKRRGQGFTYLLLHPRQLRHIIMREIRYRQRHRSKRRWMEWQKFDAYMHIHMMHTHRAELRASSLNIERIETIFDMVSSLGNGLWVLDVGCGDGVVSEPIWKMGNNVVCVELPKIAALAHRCQVPLMLAGDAENLTFASNSLDVVLASEVVEHLWNPHNFFDEAYRVLRANGHLIISTPEGIEGLRYDSHKHYFTVESLKQMLGTKFTVCEIKRLKPRGAPHPTIILLLRKLMAIKNQ